MGKNLGKNLGKRLRKLALDQACRSPPPPHKRACAISQAAYVADYTADDESQNHHCILDASQKRKPKNANAQAMLKAVGQVILRLQFR